MVSPTGLPRFLSCQWTAPNVATEASLGNQEAELYFWLWH